MSSSGVEFDESGFSGGMRSRQFSSTPVQRVSPIYAFFIRSGFARDDASARTVSLVLSVILFLVSLAIVYVFIIGDNSKYEATKKYFKEGTPASRVKKTTD
jgi:hypothetical protein